MKVLVFNGSPKKEKSDTFHITKAFLAGFESVQKSNVKVIDVIDCHVEYCRGCLNCMKNGGICQFDDDMKSILNEILESDIIVWSFPLYSYDMPAHVKAVVDRLLPLSKLAMHEVDGRYEHESIHDFSKKRYVMIGGCGFPSRTNNFEVLERHFYCLFGEEHSTVITVPESPMFNAPEADSVTKPFLKRVERAGREYALDGCISEESLNCMKVPMIPPRGL